MVTLLAAGFTIGVAVLLALLLAICIVGAWRVLQRVLDL